MPNMMRCPQCGEEIDMSEEPIFCEYCGGSLLDVRTVNDDRTVLATPPGPITNEWIQQQNRNIHLHQRNLKSPRWQHRKNIIMSSNEKGDCTDAESNPLSLLHGNN